MSELMERAVSPYTGTGDWGAVLRDAGAARRRARLRPALAFAVVVAALVVAVAGRSRRSTIDRALAAAGDGRVLHLVFEGSTAEAARGPRHRRRERCAARTRCGSTRRRGARARDVRRRRCSGSR